MACSLVQYDLWWASCNNTAIIGRKGCILERKAVKQMMQVVAWQRIDHVVHFLMAASGIDVSVFYYACKMPVWKKGQHELASEVKLMRSAGLPLFCLQSPALASLPSPPIKQQRASYVLSEQKLHKVHTVESEWSCCQKHPDRLAILQWCLWQTFPRVGGLSH